MVSVFALAPSFAQGESDDSPRPVPRRVRMSDRAAAAAAPAKIAGHDTALVVGPAGSKAREPRRASAARLELGTDMALPFSVSARTGGKECAHDALASTPRRAGH